MTDMQRLLIAPWTRPRALLLSAICLMAGIAGGWFIHGSKTTAVAASVKAASVTVPAFAASPSPQPPDPTRLKEMADTQAAPLLAKLKSDPNSPELLTRIGNFYYDAQQYSIDVEFYRRSLEARPADAAVRTDMGTAYWYMGNADAAIGEFNRALVDAPNNPNTLFNLGLVKWQGKKDGAGALTDWGRLLAANPKYEGKDKVAQMIADVKQNAAIKP